MADESERESLPQRGVGLDGGLDGGGGGSGVTSTKRNKTKSCRSLPSKKRQIRRGRLTTDRLAGDCDCASVG